MYCKLKEEYIIRGWNGVPDFLIKRPKNEYQILKSDELDALMFCDGKTNLEDLFIPFYLRNKISDFIKKGIVVVCDGCDEISEDQKYRKYDNKFIESALFSITGRCNYKCRHCYQSAPDAKFGEFDYDTIIDIIKQIDDCGIMHVSITGGEALVRDDFENIIAELTKRKISIDGIFSNGLLVTPKLLDMLDSYGQKPQFNMSYDGDDGWHDWLRNRKGADKIVLDAFDLCYEHDFPTSAGFTLHLGNIHIIRQSIQTLAKHHCYSVKVCPVDNFGQWQKFSDSNTLTTEELYQIYLDYIPQYFEDGMPVDIMLGGFFQCRKGVPEWSIPGDKTCSKDVFCYQKICGHAFTHLCISPESRMMPCSELAGTPLNETFPLITEIGLKKGLTDSRYLNVIETSVEKFFEINKECGACEYRYKCHGGCRASAANFDDTNIYAGDRRACIFFKGGWDKKVREAAEAAIAKLPQDIKEHSKEKSD